MFAKHSSKDRNNRKPRRLRLENLEGRQLMMADGVDFAYDATPGPRPAAGYTAPADASHRATPYIMNGTAIHHGVAPAVGMVNESANPNWRNCTGTLIDKQHVLTAAHCTVGKTNNQLVFVTNGTRYVSSQVFTHPYYSEANFGTDAAHDIALVRLAQAVSGVTPVPIARSAPKIGQSMLLIGYGNGGTGQTGEINDNSYQPIKRYGYTPIERVTQTLVHWTFNPNESSTMHGDSGGPAIVRDASGRDVIAGVTSGGYPAANTQVHGTYGATAFDTRVDVYANWIDGIVNQTSTTQPAQTALDAPRLLAPGGTVTGAETTLQWSAVSGAARYRVYVTDVTANRAGIVDQAAVGTTFSLTGLTAGRAYRFWVAAISSTGSQGAWSSPRDFQVVQPVANSAPTILAPTGTINARRPTFSWTAVSGAAGYHLWVDNLTTGQRGVVNGRVNVTSGTLNFALPAGHSYRMWVSAIPSNGTSGPWSQAKDFRISAYAYSDGPFPNDGDSPDAQVSLISLLPPPAADSLPAANAGTPGDVEADDSARPATPRHRLTAHRAVARRAVDAAIEDGPLAVLPSLRRLRGPG